MSLVLTRETLQDHVGQEVGVSDWLEITQKNVNLFADVTHDHQFIHVDSERAEKTPFGGTIAHGFLTMSMLSYFAESGCGVIIEDAKMSLNYGCDKLRFLKPVRVGARIRGRSRLHSIREKSPGHFLIKCNMEVEIDNEDKPALVAEWLTMMVV